MVEYGRVDAFVDYETSIKSVAQKNGIELGKEYRIKVIKPGNKLFVAFSNSERSKKFIEIFDRRMTQLAETGEIDKIYIKWRLGSKKFGKSRYGKK